MRAIMKTSAGLFVFAIVLVGVAFVVWRTFFVHAAAGNVLFLSGRIEGDDSALAPKVGGRILEVRYREGDTVRAGEVVAVLDDAQLRAAEHAAQADLLDAQTRVESAQAQIAVLEQQLQQSALQSAQARTDANGRVTQASANLEASRTAVAQQRSASEMAAFNRRLYARLAQTGDASDQQREQAETTANQQDAALAAAERQVNAARGALTTANATLANSSIFEAARAGIERQIVQQRSVVAGTDAQVAQARAQLAEARANRSDLTIRAPFSGTIITRAAEPGEVVTAGTAVMTLLDLHKVYLRGFIPEGEIGQVAVGQSARVYLDSNPNQPLDAYVERIDPQATFTPENTYFRNDRVKQVFGLKLALRGGFDFAKPGMPADGEILVRGEVWPNTRPNRSQ